MQRAAYYTFNLSMYEMVFTYLYRKKNKFIITITKVYWCLHAEKVSKSHSTWLENQGKMWSFLSFSYRVSKWRSCFRSCLRTRRCGVRFQESELACSPRFQVQWESIVILDDGFELFRLWPSAFLCPFNLEGLKFSLIVFIIMEEMFQAHKLTSLGDHFLRAFPALGFLYSREAMKSYVSSLQT